jgi:hypothetical protein
MEQYGDCKSVNFIAAYYHSNSTGGTICSHTRTPQAGEAPVQCSAPRSTHQPTRRGATPSSRSRSIDMRDSERPPRENKQPRRRPRRARQRSHVPTAPVLFFPTRARRRCARRAEPRLVSMASRHAPAAGSGSELDCSWALLRRDRARKARCSLRRACVRRLCGRVLLGSSVGSTYAGAKLINSVAWPEKRRISE